MTSVEFSIAPSTKREAFAALFGTSNLLRTQLFVAAIIVLNVIPLMHAAARHSNSDAVLYAFLSALYLFAVVVVLGLSYQRATFARTGALTFADDGLAGRLDGRTVTVAWRAVASVQNTGEFFVVRRRGLFSKLIVIPKHACADPRAFWSELDGRLVARRGLARGRAATCIVNTAA